MKMAQAGTLESNDIMITIDPRPAGSGVEIELSSNFLAQYGGTIRQVIAETLADQEINDIYVKAVDRGALNCTIKARLLAALARAGVALKEAKA